MILTGWKQIAQHLGCGVRTAQRWQREGLPVKRITKSSRAPVIADSEQLNAWMLRDHVIRSARSPDLFASINRARELRTEARRTKEALHVTMAALRKELASSRQTAEKAKLMGVRDVEFLRVEIRTGLMFSKIALEAHHRKTVNRNRANARKAYDSVRHFMPRAGLSGDDLNEIRSGLEKLKSELQQLGEEV